MTTMSQIFFQFSLFHFPHFQCNEQLCIAEDTGGEGKSKAGAINWIQSARKDVVWETSLSSHQRDYDC